MKDLAKKGKKEKNNRPKRLALELNDIRVLQSLKGVSCFKIGEGHSHFSKPDVSQWKCVICSKKTQSSIIGFMKPILKKSYTTCLGGVVGYHASLTH